MNTADNAQQIEAQNAKSFLVGNTTSLDQLQVEQEGSRRAPPRGSQAQMQEKLLQHHRRRGCGPRLCAQGTQEAAPA